MPKTHTEDRLKTLGLTPYETKCYLALLQRGTLTVPEVSTIAGVPRSNAYDALEKMMSKGMCVSRPGNTKRYSASPPDLLRESFLIKLDEETESELQKFKRDQSTALKEKEKEMLQSKKGAEADITQLVRDLQPEYEKSRKQTDPLDYIEIVKERHQIHKRFIQLLAEANEEVLAFIKPPFSNPRKKLEEQVGEGADTSKRGVRVRCIYEIARDEDEKRWQFEMIDRGVGAGEEARVLEKLPMKLAIFDSTIAIYTLPDPVSRQVSWTSQIVRHPDFASTLKIIFETLWEQAQDYHILKD